MRPTSETLLHSADRAIQRARRRGAREQMLSALSTARGEVERDGTSGWSGRRRQKRLERLVALAETGPRGFWREWGRPLLYGVLIALGIRVFVIEAFQIPSGSMEETLLVGDYLLVNKLTYGPRTPERITFYKSQLTREGWRIGHTPGEDPLIDIRLPSIHLPGMRRPRAGDIIVFANPHDTSTNYIKRCVATEGQTVEIRDKRLFVDGVLREELFAQVETEGRIRESGTRDPSPIDQHSMEESWGHLMRHRAWNRDNFGPVTVPQGHLFMLGDNRDHSLDGRYWGFLDEGLIRGKASLIYFSWNRSFPLWRVFGAVRWARLGQLIR